jgi:hypothetical protein
LARGRRDYGDGVQVLYSLDGCMIEGRVGPEQ